MLSAIEEKAKRYEGLCFYYSQPDGVLHREAFTLEDQAEVEELERDLGVKACALIQRFDSWKAIRAALPEDSEVAGNEGGDHA